MVFLAIESSCDETAAAVVEGKGESIMIHSNVVGSQARVHRKYGGVVPEVAARKHAETVVSVIKEACKDFGKDDIDAIAVTYGPGLMVALLVGVEAARNLAWSWDKPLYGVNHMEGHMVSVIEGNKLDASFFNLGEKPHIALLVSGGHTQLVYVEGIGKYKIIGETLDDAVGEAFDKVAKMLGLAYPGGPSIAKAAQGGKPDAIEMPRPMLESKDWNFSFSGIKTHVLRLIQKSSRNSVVPGSIRANIAASFQEAVTDVLVAKTIASALHYKVKTITVSGGVAANVVLRRKMEEAAQNAKLECYFAPKSLTGDNAAMIGMAAYLESRISKPTDPFTLLPNPNLRVSE